jgi:hypothetical protein
MRYQGRQMKKVGHLELANDGNESQRRFSKVQYRLLGGVYGEVSKFPPFCAHNGLLNRHHIGMLFL